MAAILLYRFFKKNRRLLFLIFLSLTAVCIFFSSRLKVEEDIAKFIPNDERTKRINATLASLKIKDKIIFNLFYNDKQEDPGGLMDCADALADSLEPFTGDYIADLQYKIAEDKMSATYSAFYENLPIYLDNKDYERINRLIHRDSINKILANNYKTLLSPSGAVFGKFIKKDPLSITGLAVKKIENLQFDANFEVNEGYIQTRDQRNLLIFLTPSKPASAYEENKRFLKRLDQIILSLSKEYKNVAIEYYGAAPVSAGNSDQIRKDTILTSLLALVAILILLFLFFKRIMVLFYILLPVLFGGLFSLTVLYFLKGEISAIAIGAGSIVLGIAINYSLHFFTHFKHERSVENVISDLTLPMLVGCATTVAAFLSLQFTKSEALHDFGLFAGLSLIGAVLFSLIVLPHLLKNKKDDEKHLPEKQNPFLEKFFNYRFDKNKPLVLITLILTVIFAFSARHVTFESDMMKMNYQDEKLTTSQKHLDEINRFSMSSVYIVTKGADLEHALRRNEVVTARLEALQKEGSVTKYSSAAFVLISDSLQKIKIQKWNAFWSPGKRDSIKKFLREEGRDYKFREDAFSDFYTQINKSFKPLPLSQFDTLKKLLVNDFVSEKQNEASLVNLVKADPERKKTVYSSFKNDNHIIVFDRQHITSQFIEVISSDFNRIVLITGFLVFGFMLLSHGRIELAVINFIPMFLSWLWILGIMALLGLKFNIINIIISTFIFGLGDDYSIFIMDGLSHEYKYGRKNLASYKTSIVLSAITNILGIGVLIFAEHPALRSIAAVTIIGMCTVLFISFIAQPLLYNFMILSRRKRKLLPYTAINLLFTGFGFLVFAIGSLLLTVFGFILFNLVPVPKRKKKIFFHFLLMSVCRGIIYMFFNVKKEIINPTKENFKKPAVIIANHQSHIDLAMILMLHPKIIVFTNDWVWNSPFYGYIVKMADFYPASQGYENALEKVKALTVQGYSVLIFPEGTRSKTGEILRFHKGAFFLAEQLQLDILPLLMHGTGDLVTKNDFHFKEGSITLKFLPRISPVDQSYGSSYKVSAKGISKMMREEYLTLKKSHETVDYYRAKLIKNYIYKGPVLEWYCKIKVSMEDNYKLFESLIPEKGKVTDIGCGYGFLSLMLSMTGNERDITGIDYDEEKIRIASNCISKSGNLNYLCEDVTKYNVPQSDAFIINDILHYLPIHEQTSLIERCVEKLNTGGIMIIRDADADKKKRHWGTRYTEFFSTNSGFNKTKATGLHFSSATLISETLTKFDFLRFKIIDETRLTSNITFVVTKI